jgi:SPRY domain-containing SOCS box protein 3
MTILNINYFKETQTKSSLLSALLSKPIDYNVDIQMQTNNQNVDQNKIKSELNTKESSCSSSCGFSNASNNPKNIPLENFSLVNWTWSSELVNSYSTLLSDDQKSICIHPYCNSCFETIAIRTNEPLKRDKMTYWEIVFDKNITQGTSVMIGVGTRNARVHSTGYLNLIGMDEFGWGLSSKGHIWHSNNSRKFCDPFDKAQNENETLLRIGCLYDGRTGTLAYYRNGVFLGVGFQNIRTNEQLYPMVSSTVSKTIMRIEFVCESFPTLKELSRNSIVNQAANQEFLQMSKNILPKTLVNYLNN